MVPFQTQDLPGTNQLITERSENQQINPPVCLARAVTPDNYEITLCSNFAVAELGDVTHGVAATN